MIDQGSDSDEESMQDEDHTMVIDISDSSEDEYLPNHPIPDLLEDGVAIYNTTETNTQFSATTVSIENREVHVRPKKTPKKQGTLDAFFRTKKTPAKQWSKKQNTPFRFAPVKETQDDKTPTEHFRSTEQDSRPVKVKRTTTEEFASNRSRTGPMVSNVKYGTIVGDGHCCFRSLCVLLGRDQDHHLELRNEISNFIHRNRWRFEHHYTDEQINAHLDAMTGVTNAPVGEAQWGTELDVYAASLLFERSFSIVDDSTSAERARYAPEGHGNDEPLVIFHDGHQHWEVASSHDQQAGETPPKNMFRTPSQKLCTTLIAVETVDVKLSKKEMKRRIRQLETTQLVLWPLGKTSEQVIANNQLFALYKWVTGNCKKHTLWKTIEKLLPGLIPSLVGKKKKTLSKKVERLKKPEQYWCKIPAHYKDGIVTNPPRTTQCCGDCTPEYLRLQQERNTLDKIARTYIKETIKNNDFNLYICYQILKQYSKNLIRCFNLQAHIEFRRDEELFAFVAGHQSVSDAFNRIIHDRFIIDIVRTCAIYVGLTALAVADMKREGYRFNTARGSLNDFLAWLSNPANYGKDFRRDYVPHANPRNRPPYVHRNGKPLTQKEMEEQAGFDCILLESFGTYKEAHALETMLQKHWQTENNMLRSFGTSILWKVTGAGAKDNVKPGVYKVFLTYSRNVLNLLGHTVFLNPQLRRRYSDDNNRTYFLTMEQVAKQVAKEEEDKMTDDDPNQNICINKCIP
jgi:hypothetical protein